MSYTVQKLAELSGVTVRTLHHYDEIELLKPSFYGSNNYRYYEKEQLLLLQQILFYRELGMPLDDIKRIMGSSDFNKLTALNTHKKTLYKELVRIKNMIKTIEKTINHLKGENKMKEKELFYGLDSPKQKMYEKYLIEKGVCAEEQIKTSREKAKTMDWDTIKKGWDKLFKDYTDAIQRNLSAASPEAQKIARKHFEHLNTYFNVHTKEMFAGLTQQYRSHPNWDKMFHKYHPKLQDFVCEAMLIFAERDLS